MSWYNILVYGLLLGGAYAVVAFGLSLIYGVMRVVNLAHGTVLMLAAYCAYTLQGQWRIDPLLALAVVLPSGYYFGWALYKTTLLRIRHETPMAAMLLLFGVSLCIRNFAYLVWTGDDRSLSLTYALDTLWIGTPVPWIKVVVFAVSVAATALMYFVLRFTHFGRALRAVTQDPVAAELSGLDVGEVRAQAFGAGTASVTVSYYSALFLAVLAVACAHGIRKSPAGLGLACVREEIDAAESIGIRSGRLQMQALALSAALVGIAGGVYARYLEYVSPGDVFAFNRSTAFILMAIIGGVNSLWGPVLGALIFLVLERFLEISFPELHLGIYGLMLVVIMIFEPRGLMAVIGRVKRNLELRRGGENGGLGAAALHR